MTAEISRAQPTSTSRLTSGLALRSTLRVTLYNTNKVTLTLRHLTSKTYMEPHKFRNNNINNMFYQYKIQYQYKQNYYMTLNLRPMTSESNKESQKDPDTAEISRVQPTSTLRLTSGLALRSTLTLTLTSETYMESHKIRNNNKNNMLYQYKIQYQYKRNYYMTLTLRPMTSESKKESQKDPDTAEISRVHPTSTLRLTSGLAL
jgi:hypothetical protein